MKRESASGLCKFPQAEHKPNLTLQTTNWVTVGLIPNSTGLTNRTKEEQYPGLPRQPGKPDMPQTAAPNPQADANRLEAATDQAIAACGGNARDAVKALILANELLEAETKELQAAVSNSYARSRFEPVPRGRLVRCMTFLEKLFEHRLCF